ncbi:lipid A deacylase LpxR family protein [Prosthecobacter sp.]|uniref:lipid A deacylase LpxR family protein n=1 Tax=Prosthecobacter sp. TaxID=1965333 RepID=UPI003784C75C
MKNALTLIATLGLPCFLHGQMAGDVEPAPLTPTLSPAQMAPDLSPAHFGALTFYFENDAFAGTDRDYTNGARISWTSPSLNKFSDDPAAGNVAGYFDDAPFMGNSGYTRNVAVFIGQSLFTPNNTKASTLVPNERPYAGWLYGGLGLVWKTPRVKNTFVLNIGVVGPWALGEETQMAVHHALGQRSPQGWSNQLRNEVGINASYERKWRFRSNHDVAGLACDFLPYAGATVGNVYTLADIGSELRFGYNLPDDFGTSGISDAATTPTPVEGMGARTWMHRFGVHMFARAEGRAVARNIFLDGNTFRSSHSVDKNVFVADLSLGMAMNWRNSKLSYAFIYRTREYKGQPEGQLFGSVMLSIFF